MEVAEKGDKEDGLLIQLYGVRKVEVGKDWQGMVTGWNTETNSQWMIIFEVQPMMERVANVGALAVDATEWYVDRSDKGEGRAGIEALGIVSLRLWG